MRCPECDETVEDEDALAIHSITSCKKSEQPITASTPGNVSTSPTAAEDEESKVKVSFVWKQGLQTDERVVALIGMFEEVYLGLEAGTKTYKSAPTEVTTGTHNDCHLVVRGEKHSTKPIIIKNESHVIDIRLLQDASVSEDAWCRSHGDQMLPHQTQQSMMVEHGPSRHAVLRDDTSQFIAARSGFIKRYSHRQQQIYEGHHGDGTLHEGRVESHSPYHRYSLPANQSPNQHACFVNRHSSFDATSSSRYSRSPDVLYGSSTHYYQQPSGRERAAHSGGSRYQNCEYVVSNSPTDLDYSRSGRQSAGELSFPDDVRVARDLSGQRAYDFVSPRDFHGDDGELERRVYSISSEHQQFDVERMEPQQDVRCHHQNLYPPVEMSRSLPYPLSHTGGQQCTTQPSSTCYSVQSSSKSKSFHEDRGMDSDRVLTDDDVIKNLSVEIEQCHVCEDQSRQREKDLQHVVFQKDQLLHEKDAEEKRLRNAVADLQRQNRALHERTEEIKDDERLQVVSSEPQRVSVEDTNLAVKLKYCQDRFQQMQTTCDELNRRNIQLQERVTQLESDCRLLQTTNEKVSECEKKLRIDLDCSRDEVERLQKANETLKELRKKENDQQAQELDQLKLTVEHLNEQTNQQRDQKANVKPNEQDAVCLREEMARVQQQCKNAEDELCKKQQHLNDFLHVLNIQPNELELDGKMLGSGSYGVIQVGCWHGSDVAVKTFHKSVRSSELLPVFLRELHICSQLHHPNIVPICGVVMVDDMPFRLVMELLQGSLSNLINAARSSQYALSFREQVDVAADMTAGITYIHSLRPQLCVHCNINSANIMITRDMRAKVGDLGTSHATNGATISDALSSQYDAVESLSNTHISTSQSDVYSLSMTLMEFFTGPTIVRAERQAQFGDVENTELMDMCTRMAQVDPMKRPTVADCLDILMRQKSTALYKMLPGRRLVRGRLEGEDMSIVDVGLI